jgi:DNA end-binding protein Ku
MARSIWNGTISFGLVSIPVGLYGAVSEKDVRFNQLHKTCGTRIKQQKFCPHCERTVETEEIDRGYELSKNHYVVVTEEDFEALPVPSKHTIEVKSFVKAEEIDPIFFDQTYYLDPTDAGRKPLALLMKALEDKKVVAVAKVALRNKENPCILRAVNGTVVMNTLYYQDEIRKPEDNRLEDVIVDDRELGMAKSLVDLLGGEFHPEEFKDEYREVLMTRIEAKSQGGELTVAPDAPEARVVNLMDALKASLEEAQRSKEKSG